ncbi:unnamed protein product [Arabis nemorensis]|uniref:C2H2-type domain-containing protein n=1 Tax=Arabis nemorensis TaxID=586526 RepID=A0A565CVR0_9BRAS|nr:unnamed protein product [Arabis nemorensis]
MEEETLLMTDDEGVDLFAKAKELFAKGDHIHALEIIEDLMLVHTEAKESSLLHLEQGRMFIKLKERAENPDVAFAYMLAAVECFWEDLTISGVCAHGIYDLAKQSGSVLYYKKFLKKAKHALSLTQGDDADPVAVRTLREKLKEQWKGLKSLIKNAELKIAESKTCPIKKCESEVLKSKASPNPVTNENKGLLGTSWSGMDTKSKRDFLKVNIAELLRFSEGAENRKDLEEILTSAKEDRKWIFWMCRTLCSKKFSSAEECMNHLEEKHDADFKPSSEMDMVKKVGKDWARKIWPGAWEPLDAVAAVEMIKNPLADVKTFKSNSGWSKKWPLAVDEERSKLLKEIKSLLVLIRDHKILSSSIRSWLISFPVRQLGKLEVSEQTFDDFHLVKTPQSICFLECHDLIHIRDFLKNIKCERDDGTDLVSRAVDSFLDRTRVKEKIDFDPEFSILLLDKRLLKSTDAPFDDEGAVDVFDPEVHYAKAHAQGDDFISWLVGYSSVDRIFARPIREHNLDIWVAVLRAVQFTCRNLGTKYAKKLQIIDYAAALTVVENLCISEDERRRNLQEDQWNRYASLLCDKCEESVPENSLSAKLLLCAVRDVLQGALHPTYDFSEDCMNFIRERKSVSDDIVLKSIHLLKSVVTHKVLS